MTGIAVGAALLAGAAVGWWAPAIVSGIGAVWLAVRFQGRSVVLALVMNRQRRESRHVEERHIDHH